MPCPRLPQSVCRRLMSTRIPSEIPNPLPAAFLRGGTSKGVFVNARHLPKDDRAAWAPVFLRLMGSPDALYGRQLNGMGGGISSLSKVMVVGPPETAEEAVDAEYTFAQIGVRDDAVDYTGNCGNLSSVAGVFAVDEGICKPEILEADSDSGSPYARARVRLWNTNTRKRVDTIFPVSRASLEPVLGLDEAAIAGVSGGGSRIVLDFLSPAGARTGTLLPSGQATEIILLDDGTQATVTLMDCANPSVLVDVERSPALFASQDHPSALSPDLDNDPQLMHRLELLRQAGARRMGLDPAAQAQPKIALVSAGAAHQAPLSGQQGAVAEHVCVRALSMGVPHKAVPMTLGLCVGVAARVPGTVVARHASDAREFVGIRHPGGLVEVGARFDEHGNVTSASVVRTGRRLMKGAVYWD